MYVYIYVYVCIYVFIYVYKFKASLFFPNIFVMNFRLDL